MKRWIMLIVAALMVFSLSCSVLSGRNDPAGGSEAEATVVVEGPDEEASTDDDASDDDASDDDASDDGASDDGASEDDMSADDETLSVDGDAMTELESYRAVLQWRIEAEDGTVTEFEMEQAVTRNPDAQRFSMTSEEGGIEFIQIEDQMWMRFGEEWIQTSSDNAEDAGQFDDFLSIGDDWAEDLEEDEYEYLGKETVNGIQTHHYQAEYTEGWMDLFDATEGEIGDIESGVANVWIADEANLPDFVVKFVIELSGKIDEETGSGNLTMTMEVTEINEPITIEAPEGAATGGLPDDVPLYPDAAEVTSMGTMTIFTAPDDVETVNDFYQEELPNNGWTGTDEGLSSDELVNSTWEKGDQTLTLTISSGDEGTDVMILLESEE